MWTRTWTALLLAAGIGILGACKNDQYCAGNPHDDCRLDGAMTCSSNEQCAAPTPVCDTGSMNCVQCTPAEASACTGTTPVCGDDNICRGCSTHGECSASDVCLPEGRCAEPAEVAYVQAGGTGAQPCAKGAPCGTLQDGVTAVNASRPYIKISGTGTLADNATTTIDGKAVTILADPGAKLDRMGDGVILEVRNTGADVRIYDLEITGASGGAGDVGISIASGGMPKLTLTRVKVTNNIGGGISASGGTLTVSQSTISGNTGGGISVTNGGFIIVNNIFFGNGSGGSTVGGINILTSQSTTNRFEFNTVSRNLVADTLGSGIQCTAGTFIARNNIVYNNGTGTNLLQVSGSCQHAFSDIGPMGIVGGSNNINMPPMFLDEANGNLHIGSASPVRGKADPTADLIGIAARDIDSDERTSPADIGADEIP